MRTDAKRLVVPDSSRVFRLRCPAVEEQRLLGPRNRHSVITRIG
jgi:hypothetical protein